MKQLSGPKAEGIVAAYLARHDFTIVERNWRTKLCEVDIIALRGRCVYFIEVKYRRTLAQGDGYAYITAQKLQRMQRAAHVWVAQHDWQGEYCLGAAAVTGENYNVQLIACLTV